MFVDGCFWHGCPEHGTKPRANADWWEQKLAANITRDRDADRLLTEAGWTVVRAWEHEAASAAAGTERLALLPAPRADTSVSLGSIGS